MKYLKLYEGWIKGEVSLKDMFSPYIDWEFIKDAEDMSLEYLDRGLYLSLFVYYESKPLYAVYYANYKEVNPFWFQIFISDGHVLDKNNIKYNVSILNADPENNDRPGYASICIEESNELGDRLKSAYPDKKIMVSQ